MTEEKKNKEEKKPEELKLPYLNFGYLGTCYLHTDKGLFFWMSPANTSLEEGVKYLEFTLDRYKKTIEENKKKKEEEELKPPAENVKKGDFKPVV